MPAHAHLMQGFRFGSWTVKPDRGLIADGEAEHKIEPLVMDVFVALAGRGGDVVTKDQLIDEVWGGRPQTDDVIARCISALRRALGDDARHPTYIETVQRRGYRAMLPAVTRVDDPAAETRQRKTLRTAPLLLAAGLLAVSMAAGYAIFRSPPSSQTGEGDYSVAVFPFECQQDTSSPGEHLCFGFAEEVISSLKQIDEAQVVRKRTVYEPELDIADDSIVTGSVQIIADSVRVAARLEDAESGVVRWSETFDGNRDNVFDIQRKVAGELRSALDDGFRPASAPHRPSFAAAEAHALGRYLFEKRDPDSIVQAIEQFRRAIDIEPGFGRAWLGLAYTYSIWPDYDLSIDRDATFAQALEIMEAGIDADPSIREAAGTVFGYIYHKQHRWAEALANTTVAISAASPGADDYHWHSRVLASVGRLEESLEYARLGAALDPEYPVIMSRLAIAYLWVNDQANAERYFDIANRMELEASIHSLAYALFLIRKGQIDEAKLRATQALQQFGLDTDWVDVVFDGIGDPTKREAALEEMQQLSESNQVTDNVVMTVAVLLGDTDTAMRIARGAEDDSSVFELEIIYLDEYRNFRQHPGFADFTAGVGLAAYWEEAGCDWQDDRIVCD